MIKTVNLEVFIKLFSINIVHLCVIKLNKMQKYGSASTVENFFCVCRTYELTEDKSNTKPKLILALKSFFSKT